MTGLTCAGSFVTGLGNDNRPRRTYLYHVVDNAWTMAEFGHQAVVWQTAVNPVVALELMADGEWKGDGVLGPEAFDAVPFLDLLGEHGVAWAMEERPAAGHRRPERCCASVTSKRSSIASTTIRSRR